MHPIIMQYRTIEHVVDGNEAWVELGDERACVERLCCLEGKHALVNVHVAACMCVIESGGEGVSGYVQVGTWAEHGAANKASSEERKELETLGENELGMRSDE